MVNGLTVKIVFGCLLSGLVQDFFLLLAEESGFSTVDLSNIWTIQDTVFIEVIISNCRSSLHSWRISQALIV